MRRVTVQLATSSLAVDPCQAKQRKRPCVTGRFEARVESPRRPAVRQAG